MLRQISGGALFIEGCVIEDPNIISLQDVPIVTPTGDVVVESISIEVS